MKRMEDRTSQIICLYRPIDESHKKYQVVYGTHLAMEFFFARIAGIFPASLAYLEFLVPEIAENRPPSTAAIEGDTAWTRRYDIGPMLASSAQPPFSHYPLQSSSMNAM